MKNLFPLSIRFWCCAPLLVASLGLMSVASVRGADWWWRADALDRNWTNRTLGELQGMAMAGHATGQFYYARSRFVGAKSADDESESLRWVTRAAEAGLSEAQYVTARFHLSGTATARDVAAGMAWASRSAAQGNPDGLAVLADLHARGEGVPQDTDQARKLFRRAVDAGSVIGLVWFGHFHLSGEMHTLSETNYAEALRCFERAASNGEVQVVRQLIRMYRSGMGTPPRVDRAVDWARVGADDGQADLMETLAEMYASGLARPRDSEDAAINLIRRATEIRARSFERTSGRPASRKANAALANGCRDLWNRYRFGIGTPRNLIAGAQWMLVAWREESQPVRGDGSPEVSQENGWPAFVEAVQGASPKVRGDDELWRESLRKVYLALEEGNAALCREIGLDYWHDSELTSRDLLAARVWLARAAQLGLASAKDDLARLEATLSPAQIALAKKRFLPQSRTTLRH